MASATAGRCASMYGGLVMPSRIMHEPVVRGLHHYEPEQPRDVRPEVPIPYAPVSRPEPDLRRDLRDPV